MSESDAEFFIRRSAEAPPPAERSSNPAAKQRHLELAERYAAAAVAQVRTVRPTMTVQGTKLREA